MCAIFALQYKYIALYESYDRRNGIAQSGAKSQTQIMSKNIMNDGL